MTDVRRWRGEDVRRAVAWSGRSDGAAHQLCEGLVAGVYLRFDFDSCLFVSIRGSVLDSRLQFAGEVVGGDVHSVS